MTDPKLLDRLVAERSAIQVAFRLWPIDQVMPVMSCWMVECSERIARGEPARLLSAFASEHTPSWPGRVSA